MASESHSETHVVETERGPIEVARSGHGPHVLVVHGTPGGSDAALALGGFLLDAGFEVIAPSRPGYLGTTLEGRESIDAQADLLAALIRALGLERAGLLSWSGGGPSAYRLAARHPELVTAMVAAAAVSHRFEPAPEGADERFMLETSAGNWMLRFLARHAPSTTVRETIAAEGELSRDELKVQVAEVLGAPRERDFVLTMAEAVADRARRGAGIDNDWAQFARIESLALEAIEAPTLIIGGDVDIDVPPEHCEYAADRIPGAERIELEDGTHLALVVGPGAAGAQSRAIDLLRAG